jgi:hypothetical protein
MGQVSKIDFLLPVNGAKYFIYHFVALDVGNPTIYDN